MIGTDILCDLSKEMGYGAVKFIVDPEDWSVIAYTGEHHGGLPLWRIACPKPLELPRSKEVVMSRARERVTPFFFGMGRRSSKSPEQNPTCSISAAQVKEEKEGCFLQAMLCIRITRSVVLVSPLACWMLLHTAMRLCESSRDGNLTLSLRLALTLEEMPSTMQPIRLLLQICGGLRWLRTKTSRTGEPSSGIRMPTRGLQNT